MSTTHTPSSRAASAPARPPAVGFSHDAPPVTGIPSRPAQTLNPLDTLTWQEPPALETDTSE
ncbi:hypothetical protein ABT160_07470 [Streptomyces sp. NPDC001941]|uniref:hypothetical protein n=1 Tax=Streptomyces sp. NPDC001941 TaxID=3154659 RepID=UPI003323615E